MPFEQKYTPETREASLARVLERREAEPGNRAIIRETAEEFEVGEQSLRGWIRVHEKLTTPEPEAAPEAAAAADEPAPEAVAAPEAPVRRGRPPASAAADSRVAELEAEVAKLRRDRETLKSALAVLLSE
ncbi:hypothetical protein EDF46_2285 [Frondihabitans sp. PhB188]|uniref:hypothetical protein n=1 Tax=Frondihabitans sp. PhB188 TaxID=2485200 RepID=UPI000F928B95|nr:hypothetical protein [Frondihabitans sp. PhB188]ROQ38644.1 hypothetical protein EDF46_2285 [Frondihabitans sp. PhB188]